MFDVSNLSAGESPFSASAARAPWPILRRTEFWLAAGFAALQVAILVGMIVLDGLPLVVGERVKLQVVPVDPRDMFRGDYVRLGYEFNNFNPGQVRGLPERYYIDWYSDEFLGRSIFVSLAPQGDRYGVASLSVDRPATGIYLTGNVVSPYRIECGIEAYYVQEGEGRRLEQLIGQRRILAEVAVWHGQAKLVRLIE
jgi:uncharacterized membrane-anchored protein